jgi:hypothetical protein
VIFDPVMQLVDGTEALTIADLVSASVNPVAHDLAIDASGQPAGTVPADLDPDRDPDRDPDLDPDRGTRVVMALLHGFVLQRVAFGLDDAEGFTQERAGRPRRRRGPARAGRSKRDRSNQRRDLSPSPGRPLALWHGQRGASS